MDSSTLPPQGVTSDICHYTIHFPPCESTPSQLTARCTSILALFHSLSLHSSPPQPYLWHSCHPPTLSLSPLDFTTPSTQPQTQHLKGSLDVSDCVDDEWFLVWLLRQVTQLYPEAVVAINDADGEFLLIEGAEVLPLWVTPTNATNRVWIHQSRLHLIPLAHTSPLPFASNSANSTSFDPDQDAYIDALHAVSLILDSSVETTAPEDLETIVWARIAEYPAKIQEHHHTTLAYLPTEIALALSQDPTLVVEAAKAFYEREPATLKFCSTMTRFPPTAPSTSLTPSTSTTPSLPGTVLTPLHLTRPLYSLLLLQRFFPPKPFLSAQWDKGARDEEDERRREVGMKVACGFEMRWGVTQGRVETRGEEEVGGEGWKRFREQLEGKGYFGTETEGSEKWNELERLARKGWAESSRENVGNRPSFATRLTTALSHSSSLLPNRLTAPLPSPSALLALESPTDWLQIDEQGLESLLASRGPGGEGLGTDDLLSDDELPSDSDSDGEGEGEGERMEGVEGGEEQQGESRKKSEEDKKAERMAKRLKEMAGKVEQFVEGRGAVDGAEFDDERSTSSDSDDEDQDPTAFPPLSPTARAARLETLVAPLSSSEWGQRTAPPPSSTTSAAARAQEEEASDKARAPRLPRDNYDGASEDDDEASEDEVMEGEEGLAGLEGDDEVEGEEGPAVVGGEEGDEEMNMEEEMDEFLKFATETLGLTEEQYGKILGERRERGAFVPTPSTKPKKTNVVPSSTTTSSTSSALKPTPKPTVPNPPLRNPNLTDFDALMMQMDQELAKVRSSSSSSAPAPTYGTSTASSQPKPKATPKPNPKPTSTRATIESDSSADEEEDDDDDPQAMDAELAALFATVSGQDPTAGEPVDLNLVKNFLESFQSQGGFGGPAGNLAGRLGFQMPKDA
ncbi:SGT1 protein-domain-containing protein [Leucosporidium creatinivorum]|uniref:SGT1 protein-domain-containing protein n=1 Tax=Leucosporidium creatinivorum TaxID=106004 RepID=A0A1Y2D6U1_9BASI|nr:SGT1 protein-domain-containing protein [Leucosporidium creatinivorum]